MAAQENVRRLSEIAGRARSDGVDGAEYMRRIIQRAVLNDNPFIRPDDEFVVMGMDGFDGSIFPCGSFKTLEEAQQIARKKIEEEPLFSDSEEISTTFHVFNQKGFHIPLEETD